MRVLGIGLVAFLAAPAAWADLPIACEGRSPEWFLTLAGPIAQLEFLRRAEFEIPHSTAAEGREWPKAYTLISDFDTAIVLIDETTCQLGDQNWPITAQILTQRGQTPILLTGCCTVVE